MLFRVAVHFKKFNAFCFFCSVAVRDVSEMCSFPEGLSPSPFHFSLSQEHCLHYHYMLLRDNRSCLVHPSSCLLCNPNSHLFQKWYDRLAVALAIPTPPAVLAAAATTTTMRARDLQAHTLSMPHRRLTIPLLLHDNTL